jgi:hypothetical protein
MAKAEKVKLTDPKVDALKKRADGRYEVLDTLVPGFGVRVSDKGVRTFMLKTRYPGSDNPTRRALGEYPVISLAEAREKAIEWRKMIKRGIDPAIAAEQERAATRRKQETTFGAVAEDFIAEKLPGERKGKEVARNVRVNFGGVCPEDDYVKGAKKGQLLGPWAKRPIEDITDEDIVAVIKAKKRTAPAQARNLLGIAKRMFAWVVDQRSYGLKASPAETLRPTKIVGEKAQGTRILTNDETLALWRAAERTPYPYGPAYKMLILTALRLNEAADASWPEFDPEVVRLLRSNHKPGIIAERIKRLPAERRIWVVPAARMKGRNNKARDHAVPLTDDIVDLLVNLKKFKSGNFLFSTSFGTSPVWMSDKVKKRLDERMLRTLRALARRRGDDPMTVTLPHWTNHDIRRTVRSNLSRLRVTEEAREAVLAHARPGIKGTYDHHDYFDEKREALELWAGRLRSIIEPPPTNVVALPVRA